MPHRGRCLLFSRGRTSAQAGEAGGKWILRQVVPLAPFPGGHEKLYVFKLRHLWAMGMKATSDVVR